MLRLDTPHGPANVRLEPAREPRGALVLGHGAGGGVDAPDLAVAAEVARVEQPYRVAGRRSPAPARQLDSAWTAVVEQLLGGELRGLALIAGGRSMGARVACRTADATGAAGVMCLAFPLQPPRRKAAAGPAPSRLEELDALNMPVLVVQGTHDPFGMPPPAPGRAVVRVAGNHSLRKDLDAVAAAVREWLPGVVAKEGRAQAG
jgi:predicted alpha/beta-hydrolase family hydrolase